MFSLRDAFFWLVAFRDCWSLPASNKHAPVVCIFGLCGRNQKFEAIVPTFHLPTVFPKRNPAIALSDTLPPPHPSAVQVREAQLPDRLLVHPQPKAAGPLSGPLEGIACIIDSIETRSKMFSVRNKIKNEFFIYFFPVTFRFSPINRQSISFWRKKMCYSKEN